MQLLERILPLTVLSIACVGCGESGTSAGSSATQTSPTAPPTSADTNASATMINDTDPAIIYSKGNKTTVNWQAFQAASQDYQQDEHSGNFVRAGGAISGIGAVVNFSGTGITWIGKKGPQYGIAAYSIDGGAPQSVDNYNSSEVAQSPNVTISGLSADSHVLSISLIDQKHASSSDYWQTIDAFNVTGTALPPSQGTTAGFNSAELKFTGTWESGATSDGSDLSGGHYWSKQANASVSWTFVGSLIEVFGRPDYENGYMDVYLDAAPDPVASINSHWGSKDDDTLNSYMLFAKKLPAGQHTIRIVVTGKHDDSAEDSYVQIDQFMAFQ